MIEKSITIVYSIGLMLFQCLIRKSTLKANYFYDLIFVRLSKLITISMSYSFVFLFFKEDILFYYHTS